jgi:hypothetical protein
MVCRVNFRKAFILTFVAFVFVLSFISFARAASFEVGSVLVKVSLIKGAVIEKKLTVTTSAGGRFSARLTGIRGVILSESSFDLDSGESRTLNLIFNSANLTEGIYVGNVVISSAGEDVSVPVIFEIESSDLFFDSNLDVPPQYQKILPSSKLVAQIRLFDLTSGATSEGMGNTKVDVEYKVYSVATGREISTESESVVINKVTPVTKTVQFTKNIKQGFYVFSVIVKYKTSIGVSSYLFEISSDAVQPTATDQFDWKFIAALLVIFFLFLSMIFLFVYLLKDRDRMMAEMREYNDQELRRQKELLEQQSALIRKRKLASASKVKSDIRRKLRILKEKHRKRIQELSGLKRKGDTKAMVKKMKEWKSKGYNISPLEYKMDSLSKKEMTDIMDNWRAKGYKLG